MLTPCITAVFFLLLAGAMLLLSMKTPPALEEMRCWMVDTYADRKVPVIYVMRWLTLSLRRFFYTIGYITCLLVVFGCSVWYGLILPDIDSSREYYIIVGLVGGVTVLAVAIYLWIMTNKQLLVQWLSLVLLRSLGRAPRVIEIHH